MKHILLPLSLLLALSLLPSCKPASDSAAEESNRILEQAQMEQARQAAELQQRSDDLQQQLADLQKVLQEKETAELKARLESIRQENERLAADAQAARQKSLSLAEELERSKLPRALPYVPLSAPAAPQHPWTTPDDNYSLFYESLRPHGKWVEVDGYGYAFRPGLANRPNWRPYVDGRWTWTDQGWAWDSNEPFGWACYHYGRWVQVSRHGWLWVPGREWAPAWVSWRYGDDCVGWAPLPPGAGRKSVGHDCDVQFGLGPSSYTFINAGNFGRTSYVNVSLSITSITRLFQQTLNVTRIVPSNHGSVFTQRGGPDLDWVQKHCESPVVRAPVYFRDRLDRAPDFRRGHDHGHPGFDAAPLEIVQGKSKPGTPLITERIQQPVMIDAWKDVPVERRQTLKEVMLRQAQLPQPRPALADTPRQVEPALQLKQPGTDSSTQAPSPPGGVQPTLPFSIETGRNPERPEFPATPGSRLGSPDMNQGGRFTQEPGKGRLEDHRRLGSNQPQPGKEVHESGNNVESEMMKAREEQAARQQEAAQLQQQQAEAMKAREEDAKREAEMQEQRGRETEMKAQQEAAMRAAQEAAERQREAAERAQREAMEKAQQEAAMRAAQEAAERQREAAERAQREAMERAQQEAAMRAAQEAAERQREAAERAQREAMERAQQEAAERQREMQRQQQEEARRQAEEAARRQAEEAAQRAAEEAGKQQGQ